jgi:3-oxoacyl-[acyl-carrier-protein] synthase-1
MSAVLGLGLTCARGRTLREAVAAIRRGEATPTARLDIPTVDGKTELPYYAGARPLDEDAVVAAIESARAESGLGERAWREAALLVGSSCMTMPQHEREGAAPVRPEGGYRVLARQLQRRTGIAGPDFTINTACTSAAHALLLAQGLIKQGRVAHAVVVGLEVRHRFTAAGFFGLQLLATDAIRPFDAERSGLVFGEAVGVAVLGGAQTGKPRLAGGANRIDLNGATGADASGASFEPVLQQALAAAAVPPSAIALVMAQAAGSRQNDAAEARALARVFAPLPPVVSLKPYVGHTLGAAGAVELALLLGAWREGFVPATAGFANPDAELSLVPSGREQAWRGGIAALDFIGFGGGQAVLIVRDDG